MPTVFTEGRFRFFFFSREESRRHVHVSTPEGEVKVWLEPEIEVAKIINLKQTEVNEILKIVKLREEEINEFWRKHFGKD